MYSVSNSKVWVFAAKMADDEEDGVTVKLIKCAVIDCCVPVFSISVSFGFLILGEENGVRVFPLRLLVKGRAKKHHRRVNRNPTGGLDNDKPDGQRLNLLNGLTQTIDGSDELYGNSVICSTYGDSGLTSKYTGTERTKEISSNGYLEGKTNKHFYSVKLRSVKLIQDSRDGDAYFAAFKSKEVESFNSTKIQLKTAKAISIQALSPNKFLILDSVGDIHYLHLSNPVLVSEIPCHMNHLTCTMRVQMLAVLPDMSPRMQTVWISDRHHTIQMMAVSDVDGPVSESDRKGNKEKFMQISVLQAIFASENIQEVIPLAANAILVLGQGSIFANAIS